MTSLSLSPHSLLSMPFCVSSLSRLCLTLLVYLCHRLSLSLIMSLPCLSLCLFVGLIYVSVCLTLSLSVSVCLSLSLSVYLCLFVSLYLPLSQDWYSMQSRMTVAFLGDNRGSGIMTHLVYIKDT